MSKRVLLFTFSLTLLFALLGINGCSNRAAQAQKLFDKGEYQKVMDNFSDLEIGRRARAKVAEELVNAKNYSEVLANYRDTPAAFKAKNELARQLFDAGRYQAVLDSFPGSQFAASSRDKLVDSLITVAAFDTLFKRFPDAPRATAYKDSLSKVDLEAAKKLKGKAKEEAFDLLLKKWPGTASYKEASRLLQEIRSKAGKK
ncbi:hypothetical protein HZB60_10320 [candidate division KSB1 bacterium]|nr:hypothetical protein [candidate division KSB1 bacterium]